MGAGTGGQKHENGVALNIGAEGCTGWESEMSKGLYVGSRA